MMNTTHVEVLVEEVSMERTLRSVLPRVLESVSLEYRVFNGKVDLLAKLPARLGGYAKWFGANERILVVVDRDNDDCRQLKDRLNAMAGAAGLSVCTRSGNRLGQVLTRIAIEELEAWFFGDVEALRTAYPRVPASLGERRGFRDPDAMTDTWEKLQSVLQQAGYHPGGLRKTVLADDVAPHLSLRDNRSHSFQTLVSGVRYLVEGAA